MQERPDIPSTSQQLANQLFDSANAEQRKMVTERVPVPPAVTRQRAVQVALAVAVPILIAVLLATFAWQPLMSFFEPAPSPAMAHEQAQAMLDELVVEIDSFRRDYEELPETLVEVGVPPRGQWSYAALSNGKYRVEGTLYGQSVSFDSTGAAVSTTKDRP